MLAHVGIGANLGDAAAAVRAAIDACGRLPRTRLVAASSLYRSAPVDAAGDDYVNAAVRLATALAPRELLAALHDIERAHGRQRSHRNAPRTLDLDLLLHGDATIDEPRLVVPHPRLHRRAFVLAPLAEIDASIVGPGRGRVGALLEAVRDQRVELLYG